MSKARLARAVKCKSKRFSDGWHAYPPKTTFGEPAMLVPMALYERLTRSAKAAKRGRRSK